MAKKKSEERHDIITNTMVALIYILLRDHITFGVLEQILKDLKVDEKGPTTYQISESYQRRYARGVVIRMLYKDAENKAAREE